ncbi:hypothetical protein QWI17_14700 [Gilvimarinus sp. SDUM040013]|uniref:Chromosome partition protein Smc n=1 Tax=Gilvimarinus gilvus TaxID=3058038 RepID=A0ABU4RV36_9GAMM|nr:hypothetical protein [Gilvimarinus sp. SDUM040013]MDO3387093.1 hypothetical protein [Gilvimarinus sp. SDUM040013]MDX6848012.1 hypothetical protein [Gilvimarinus sp. SDUM040013]
MERKEPTLGGISAERDDHHEPVASGASRSRASVEPQVVHESSGPGFVAVFALLLAIAGIGGSGYLAYTLTESQKALVAAQNRITNLEAQLNLNSNESNETVDQIRDKLEWADSEIRKLWGVSHDTNRKRIQANQEAIAANKRTLSSAEKDAASARAATASLKRDVEAELAGLQTQLASAQEAMATLTSSADRIESLSLDVQRVMQQMPGLRGLAARVKTNEEAIAAIDAYRRSINRDILQLKQQLGGAP